MICSSLAGGVGVSSVGWSGVIGFGAVLVMKRSSPVLRGARGAGGAPGWCCGVWGLRVEVWGLCRGRVSVPSSWPLGGML